MFRSKSQVHIAIKTNGEDYCWTYNGKSGILFYRTKYRYSYFVRSPWCVQWHWNFGSVSIPSEFTSGFSSLDKCLTKIVKTVDEIVLDEVMKAKVLEVSNNAIKPYLDSRNESSSV